jgi:hypothetical protein
MHGLASGQVMAGIIVGEEIIFGLTINVQSKNEKKSFC